MKSNSLRKKLTLFLLASAFAQTNSYAVSLPFSGQSANGSNNDNNNSTSYLQKGMHYFQGSWSEIQLVSRQQNRPVFVEIYAENYAPSHLLSDLLAEDSVAEYYNQHFINYRIDINSVMGNTFIKNYRVAAAGELLFFAPNGSIVSHQAGATSLAQIKAIGQSVIKQTTISLAVMEEEYNKGYRSPAFLYDFAYNCV